MRNLVEFPITKEEIINCLSKLKDDLGQENLMGDMRPMLLNTAILLLIENDPPFYDGYLFSETNKRSTWWREDDEKDHRDQSC